MKRHKRLLFAAAALLMFSSCAGTGTQPAPVSFFAMDTYMTLTPYGSGAEKAAAECEERIKQLEALWDVNSPDSDISRINSTGSAVTDPETSALIRFAAEMYAETDGALDITLYPVLCEWGFTTGEYQVPTAERLAGLLENTGADRITVSGDTVSVPEGFMLDTGALAKGRAGDCAAEIMRRNGVVSALLDLGGNIRAVGRKPDGEKWRIGLKDPQGRGIFGVIEAEDCSVVTSGGYERYFESGGEVYWHILDPKTGRPAKNGVISATVVGSDGDGMLCDALSTALFVMGEEKAERYWREKGGFEFVLVTDGGRVLISEGLEDCYSSEGLFSETEVVRRVV